MICQMCNDLESINDIQLRMDLAGMEEHGVTAVSHRDFELTGRRDRKTLKMLFLSDSSLTGPSLCFVLCPGPRKRRMCGCTLGAVLRGGLT
jgi:hypothetical protein